MTLPRPDVLLVEDDPAFYRLARTLLEGEGYSVRACTMAKEGLRHFRERKPDLSLLDVGLPDGNGYDLCRTMRGEAPEMPILFLTGRNDIQSRLRAFEAGAQDYLQKPFSFAELAARVRVHLRVKQRSDDLAKRNMELELRERIRRDITDMIVHDLKSPLSAIIGTLQLIRSQGMISNNQYEKLLSMSENAGDMMLMMINDILDVARSEQVGLTPEIADVRLPALAQKLNAFFEPVCQRHGLRYGSEVGGRAPEDPIKTDQQLLFRILANLISNAVKFSPPSGEVLFSCERRADLARFSVMDRGRGVPDKDKERIFQKFAKDVEDGPLERGSGVGLAFCGAAAKALQGRIWVEDRSDGGSRFVLELPPRLAAPEADLVQ